VRELSAAMVGEDIVYLGDSARVPYGSKSLETIRRFAMEAATFLLRFNPKMVVVACNSASAAGIDALEASVPVPTIDVIRPSAAAAIAATDGIIGVIGTSATVASGAYQRQIQSLDPKRQVIAVACPLLVPIVEEGRDVNDPIVTSALCGYLGGMQRARVGALILGCTHYPLLSGAIAKLMGPHVRLINSGQAAAGEVQRRLAELKLVNPNRQGGTLHCYTTDSAAVFGNLGERFGGRKIDHVAYVSTDELALHAPPAGA
jgi:glutamate racemase